jgi:hypothetical protein
MNRETHRTAEFRATDENGDEYTIYEYQEVGERRSMEKTEWIKMGPPIWRLDDGTPVNKVDDDTFKIATTDITLKRSG